MNFDPLLFGVVVLVLLPGVLFLIQQTISFFTDFMLDGTDSMMDAMEMMSTMM